MPRPTVYTSVMDVLERRILAGQYMLQDLPGERKIASEVGVSYMTARKAVTKLIEANVLTRRSNGTLMVHPRYLEKHAKLRVALLIPAYPSTYLTRCRLALDEAAKQHGAQLRTVEYSCWHDSIFAEAQDGADGMVVIPSTEPLPAHLLESFTGPESKVVFFDTDMSAHGIPSVRLFAAQHFTVLLDHLRELGHTRVDCLNTQGHNEDIDQRLTLWRDWLAQHGLDGQLWDDPAPPYTDPLQRAHEAMHRILNEHGHDFGAIVCTTQPAALGAVRACRDQGLRVGEDISICTMNNEPTGRYFCPSLTGLDMPDIVPLVEPCFEWFRDSRAGWSGQQCVHPKEINLFIGESAGPARPAPSINTAH